MTRATVNAKTKPTDGNSLNTARVEAIFLSPDPEEGSSGTSKELWRYAKGVQLGNRILPLTGHQKPNKSAKNPAAKSNEKPGPSLEDLFKEVLKTSHLPRPGSAGGNLGRARETTTLSTKRGKSLLILPGKEREYLQLNRADESPPPRRSRSAVQLRRFSDTITANNWFTRRGSMSSERESFTPTSSRRSSGASITISVSTPESPTAEIVFVDDDDERDALHFRDSRGKRQRFLLSRRYGNTLTLEDPSEEFVRLRKTATTVHSATRFRPKGDYTIKKLWKSKILARMDSTPSMVPRLNLGKRRTVFTTKTAHSSTDLTPQTSLDTGRSLNEVKHKLAGLFGNQTSPCPSPSYLSVTSASPSGVCWPASRPSSALSFDKQDLRPASPTALNFKSVSRPWTPAPSPQPNTRKVSQTRRCPRPRTPVPMVAPLQALNRKVRTILGCASALMELYTKRSSSQQTSRSETTKLRSVKTDLLPKTLEAKPKTATFAEKVSALTVKKQEEKTNKSLKPLAVKQQARQQVKPVVKLVPKPPALPPIRKKVVSLPQKTSLPVKYVTKPRSLPPPVRSMAHLTKSKGASPRTLVSTLQKSRAVRPSRAESAARPAKREQYTDKDRAAAVVLGDIDIKTTLEKQLKSERGRYVLPKESPAQVYLTQADFEMRIGGFETAHKLLTKALELQPGDKNALVSRSRCRLLLGDAKGALEDAEQALDSDRNHVKAIYQKAEVLYHVGKFEEALVFYHLGSKQRPDMEAFHQGIHKAQEAIEVSLGVDCDRKPTKRNPLYRKDVESFGKLPPLNLGTENESRRRETSLLGALQVDKQYLQKLIKNSTLKNSTEQSQKIVKQAKEALQFLKSREDFWRLQQPLVSSETMKILKRNKSKQSRFLGSSKPTISLSQTSVSSFKEAASSSEEFSEESPRRATDNVQEKDGAASDSGILENDHYESDHGSMENSYENQEFTEDLKRLSID